MKVFTAEVQVDRKVLDDYQSKPTEEFTDQEIEEMRGIVNECCSKLEKYGFVRVQDQLN